MEQTPAICRKFSKSHVGGRPKKRYNPSERYNRFDVHRRSGLIGSSTPKAEAAAGGGSNGSAAHGGSPVAARLKRRATAQSMAASQRDISVSEFFAKNRHLLGFDNPRKALLTTVKEAVDNALDACEEAGILPEIWVHIERVGQDRFKVGVQDNGPGILRKHNPADLRQAALRLEVPPPADEPRAAGHRHQRRRACTAC